MGAYSTLSAKEAGFLRREEGFQGGAELRECLRESASNHTQ